MPTKYLVTFFSVSDERVVEADDYWVESPLITFIKFTEQAPDGSFNNVEKLCTFADVCSVTRC